MYRLIAVPLEGSALDEHALAWAILLGRSAQCGIELIRVLAPPTYAASSFIAATPTSEPVIEDLRADAERALRQKADEVRLSLGHSVHFVVVEGVLPGALETQLEQGRADLVVMAMHDRDRLERMLFGSISDSVVRHVHRPVLVVRGEDSAPPLVPQIQHILIPLDGSPFAEQILPHAQTFAQLMGARVTLISVLEPMLSALEPELMETYDPSTEPNPLEAGAEALRAAGLVVDIHVVADRQAGHAINEFAEQHQVDVIAMTTHGRGGLGRLVAGSVAQRILHGNAPAILVYRPKTS